MMHKLGTFLRDARAGATAIAAATVAVMGLAGTALVTDHLWLVDQRDTLKNASDAATVAAVHEMSRLSSTLGDDEIAAALEPTARRYIEINLRHLTKDRFERAKETLEVTVTPDPSAGTVTIEAEADLGGTLMARAMSLLGSYTGPETMRVESGVESAVKPIEVVLAVDITSSMGRDLNGESTGTSRIDIVKQAARELVETLNPQDGRPVAVGLVPWHLTVRLNDEMRRNWERDGWATYATEQYYPYPYRVLWPASTEGRGVTQSLPNDPGEAWRGCLQQRSWAETDSPGRTPALPSREPFTQSYFLPAYGRAYQCFQKPYPAGYESQKCYDSASATEDEHSVLSTQRDCDNRTTPMLPLSTNKTTLLDEIASLRGFGGGTYSTLGILWGQRMLTPEWRTVWGHAVHPVAPDDAAYAGLRKAIVLLTDGADTYPYGELGVSRAPVCAVAKNAGIEIFVVAAMARDDVGTTLEDELRNCSSQSSYPDGQYVFVNNETNADLLNAFREIARQLMTTRRTH